MTEETYQREVEKLIIKRYLQLIIDLEDELQATKQELQILKFKGLKDGTQNDNLYGYWRGGQ